MPHARDAKLSLTAKNASRSGTRLRLAMLLATVFLTSVSISTAAEAHLQCVPYARAISGIDIHGDARTWWDQASGLYGRGQEPEIGAVLAFRATSSMPLGHVAVVSAIIDSRHVLLDQANWSRPGQIERDALAVDVSAEGDWSAVRVWYAPTEALGTRINPTYGFIYHEQPGVQIAELDDVQPSTAVLASVQANATQALPATPILVPVGADAAHADRAL